MRYLLLITVMCLGSAFASAEDQNSTSATVVPGTTASAPVVVTDGDNDHNSDKRGNHEVRFECFFRTRHKKEDWCKARGEVCVDFGGKEDSDRCRRDRGHRDFERVRVWCGDGYENDKRATGFIVRRGERDRDRRELVIETHRDWDRDGRWLTDDDERGEDRIEIQDFDREDRDDRGDRDLASYVDDDRNGDRPGRRERDEDLEASFQRFLGGGGERLEERFWGRCRVFSPERDRDHRDDPKPPAGGSGTGITLQ